MNRQKHILAATTEQFTEDIEVVRRQTRLYFDCKVVECGCAVRWSQAAHGYIHDCWQHYPKHDHGHRAEPNFDMPL